jgi:hypothetical protein
MAKDGEDVDVEKCSGCHRTRMQPVDTYYRARDGLGIRHVHGTLAVPASAKNRRCTSADRLGRQEMLRTTTSTTEALFAQ